MTEDDQTCESLPFDADGYPTDDTLQRLETMHDISAALDLARAAWHWPDFATETLRPDELTLVHAEPGQRFVRFATGGWSGNEDIIEALDKNWLVCTRWRLSAAGGLHIFEYPSRKTT